jgi:hypothetical protein
MSYVDVATTLCLELLQNKCPTITTGNKEFAISQIFAVCQRMAKNIFAIRLQKTDGKELTDDK